ncbi:LysR family transcriptional regulator [Pseudonocardia spinosispora]|uniref:LysR family transcriptional regulator n=1 Tax=Pseudonocardia spinosispora TaxID=103441 RepID=UPI00040F5A38|nr:LysR family transcriptional regulator [Pseudonocardia spinosispora]
MLDLRRLRLLRELHRRGTISAVADALSYSPSTISQQLSQLAREAGVALLEPEGRRLKLTPQAEILVAHTETIMRALAAAESEIAQSMTELTSTVRISAFQTVNLTIVPVMLTMLSEAFPRLRVEVIQVDSTTTLRTMITHDVDLVIGEEYPGYATARPAELERVELCDDRMRLALPPGDPRQDLAELAEQPWVMEPEGCASRQWSIELCRLAGFDPDIRYETSDIQVHKRLVEMGHAAAFLPDIIWIDQRPTVSLRALPGGPHVRKLFTAVGRGSGEHPAIAACREALRHAVRRIEDTVRP